MLRHAKILGIIGIIGAVVELPAAFFAFVIYGLLFMDIPYESAPLIYRWGWLTPILGVASAMAGLMGAVLTQARHKVAGILMLVGGAGALVPGIWLLALSEGNAGWLLLTPLPGILLIVGGGFALAGGRR